MTYDKYLNDCKAIGHKPTLSLKQFNEMMGIENEPTIPSLIRTQTHAKVAKPTQKLHEEMEG